MTEPEKFELQEFHGTVAAACALIDMLREQRQELINLAVEAIAMCADLHDPAADEWCEEALQTLATINRTGAAIVRSSCEQMERLDDARETAKDDGR